MGDQFLLSTMNLQLGGNRSNKLGFKFISPFLVRDKISWVAYKIQPTAPLTICLVFHMSKLRRFLRSEVWE